MSDRQLAAPNDPKRCTRTTKAGQCKYLATVDDACQYHSKVTPALLEREQCHRYLIQQSELAESYDRHSHDPDYLSLRDEISLTQALVEQRLAMIKTETDTLLAIPQITALLARLESMKINLLKIQAQLGLVLTREQVNALAGTIAQVLDNNIDDKDLLAIINQEIAIGIQAQFHPKEN